MTHGLSMYRFFIDNTGGYFRPGNYMASDANGGWYIRPKPKPTEIREDYSNIWHINHLLKKSWLIEITPKEAHDMYPAEHINWNDYCLTENNWTIDL